MAGRPLTIPLACLRDDIGNVCDPCTSCGYNQCAESCYDLETGACVVSSVQPDGAPCADSTLCTEGDACRGGVCTGTPVVCPDPGPCGEPSTCSSGMGCVTRPKANGTACDDGDRCTANDACTMGHCLGTPREACPVDQYKCYRASGGKPLADSIEFTNTFGRAAWIANRRPTSATPSPTTSRSRTSAAT